MSSSSSSDANDDAPPPSSSAPSSSLRPSLIANGVSFLTHEKVVGADSSSKRDFLSKKGLTPEEIDEAERQAAQKLDSKEKSTPEAASVASGKDPATKAPQKQTSEATPKGNTSWSMVALGLGATVAVMAMYGKQAAASVKKLLDNNSADTTASSKEKELEDDRRRQKLDAAADSLAERSAELQKSITEVTTALAKAESLRASMELQSSISPSPSINGDELRRELRAFGDTLSAATKAAVDAASEKALEASRSNTPAASPAPTEKVAVTNELREELDAIKELLRSSLTSPLGNRELLTGGGVLANPTDAPAYDAGSATRVAASSLDAGNATPVVASSDIGSASAPAPDGPLGGAPHSARYQEVLDLLARGETPPNVRADIRDTPPDPAAPLPSPALAPRSKPWERSGGGSSSNGDDDLSANAAPWRPPPRVMPSVSQ